MSGTGRSFPLPLGPMVAIGLLQKVSTSVSFGLYAHTPCALVCSISYVFVSFRGYYGVGISTQGVLLGGRGVVFLARVL